MYIVDFAQRLFRKGNVGTIIYLVINIAIYVALFGGFSQPQMAVLALMMYLICLCIALSPVGEFILRLQNGCRRIKRKDYLDRLMPIFQDVYARARQADPSISEKVTLYMCDDSDPNAFATGRKTICLTKGLITYTDAQIKGVLAHEFGHLAHKDTDLILLISVGNMLMNLIFVIWRVIFFIFGTALAIAMRSFGALIMRIFIDLLLVFAMWCWSKIGTLLVMHSSRQNEFEADKFAWQLGYGADLCVVLDSFEGSGGKGLWANLASTHPDTNDRISRLQELGVTYSNAYGHSIHAVNVNPEAYGYAHETPPVFPELPAQQGYNYPLQGYASPMPAAAAFAPQGQHPSYQAAQPPMAPPPGQYAPSAQQQYAQPVQQQAYAPQPQQYAPPVQQAPAQQQYAQPVQQAAYVPPMQQAPTQQQYASPVQPTQQQFSPAQQVPPPPPSARPPMPASRPPVPPS